MAIAEVKKVQILAHSQIMMEILSSLQEAGLIQLEGTSIEELESESPAQDISQLEHHIHRLSHALSYLSRWEEKGFLEKMFGQKPQLERMKRKEVLNFDYFQFLEKIEKLEEERNGLLSEIQFLEKEKEFLAPLEGLRIPLSSFRPTESTELFLGSLPPSRHEDLEKLAEEQALWHEVVGWEKRRFYLLLIYPKKEKSYFEQALKDLNFVPIYFTEAILKRAVEQDRVKDLIEKIAGEIEDKKRRGDELERECQKLSIHRGKLMPVYDVLLNEREKIFSARHTGNTEHAFCLEGWICSSEITKLKSKLDPYQEMIDLHFREPLPEENPPVVLENPKAGKPFEVVTKLFGLPQQGSIDPTLPLTPFFFIFVGLCVSEAGYGLVMAFLSFLYIKFAKPKAGGLQFAKLLLLLGISNIIFGTLLGGWFGFPIRSLLLIDPLQNPLPFLYLSLILGLVQVWFGTFLNMLYGIKKKNYLQSIFVQGGWLLLLPSLVLYGLTKGSIWGILSLVGAAGIVFFASPKRNPIARIFGGLYSLYDISRYVADILSYSRLLALGLSTTVIAMVVNTLCQTALKIPWLGWLLAALIFVGGHTFNLAISFLGGFVHSMRLQFVEFFNRFFKAGGKAFRPFELEGKYVDFI